LEASGVTKYVEYFRRFDSFDEAIAEFERGTDAGPADPDRGPGSVDG
jgi:hypothetical protein